MSVSRSRAESAAVEGRDRRAEDRDRILQYLRNHPEGVPLVELVRDLFYSSDSHQVKPSQDAHYRFALRYAEESEHVKIDRGLDVLQVEPRPSAFHLSSRKHFSNTDAVGRFPKNWTQNFLETFDLLTPGRKEVIERQFVEYLKQIEDRYAVMEHKFKDDDYVLAKYRTLYNDLSRAADNRRRYQETWENATREYSEGVFVTLTTDPRKFDNLADMADGISENFNRLMSWLQRRLGNRPDYVKVLEWTGRGRPHLHVVFFGVDWLVHQSELSRYWDKYQARVVDIRKVDRVAVGGAHSTDAVNVDGGSYVWLSRNPETGETRDEKSHLGKYLSKQMPAEEDVGEVEDRVGEDEGLWCTALFWATGKHFWSSSQALKVEEEVGLLPDLPEYEFRGSARYGDIPGHVRRNARVLGAGGVGGKDPPLVYSDYSHYS